MQDIFQGCFIRGVGQRCGVKPKQGAVQKNRIIEKLNKPQWGCIFNDQVKRKNIRKQQKKPTQKNFIRNGFIFLSCEKQNKKQRQNSAGKVNYLHCSNECAYKSMDKCINFQLHWFQFPIRSLNSHFAATDIGKYSTFG